MKIELVGPSMDKGWSFQMTDATPDMQATVVSMLKVPMVQRARPFLQGNYCQWMMVEFWTDNENDILIAADILERSVI